jgi:hypothetical protein
MKVHSTPSAPGRAGAPARACKHRRALVTVVAAGLLAGCPLALAAGGLSITPEIVEHVAQPGPIGSLTVSNTTAGPLAITVTPRPWLQAPGGAITPNPKKSLANQVIVSGHSFTLAPGDHRSLTLILAGMPIGGSLYGAIEVIGQPPAPAKTTGVVLGYRLVGSLRIDATAAQRRLRLKLASPRLIGSAARRQLVQALTNAGNTIDPVSGSARITGVHRTRTLKLAARAIVPGATVDLPLGATKGLPRGSYRVRVSLQQAGKTVLTATRSIHIH